MNPVLALLILILIVCAFHMGNLWGQSKPKKVLRHTRSIPAPHKWHDVDVEVLQVIEDGDPYLVAFTDAKWREAKELGAKVAEESPELLD